MVRNLTRPYFLESCGSVMLLWRCYTTKEASQFKNKVAQIMLAEMNIETSKTFLGYAISLKHMLWTCFNQQQKNKVKFGGSLRDKMVGISVGVSSFGWFLGDFGWFLLVQDDFGWFQVVCCFGSYTNFKAYRRVNSLLYSLQHVTDWCYSIFLFKVKQQECLCYCCLVA